MEPCFAKVKAHAHTHTHALSLKKERVVGMFCINTLDSSEIERS